LLLLIGACAENEEAPVGAQLLGNTNISDSPNDVSPWSAQNFTGFQKTGVSKEVFLTGFQSLYIDSPDEASSVDASWTQTYSGPMPPAGSTLELSAFVKGVNIERNSTGSIGIFMRIFPQYEGNNFIGRSAASQEILEGDFDWSRLKITLEKFPANAESITVTLFMPNLTTGRVYFDEITLTVR
jgi:hypothetical protein